MSSSRARKIVEQLVAASGEATTKALDAVLSQMTVTEIALIGYDWRELWARPKQVIPDGPWRSLGFLTARRFGKTRAIAEWVNEQVYTGRAHRIGFAAQNSDKTREVMVDGESGLIATSPPWCRAKWTRDRVLWSNGAEAFPFTPEVPGNFRGPGLHIFWASELQVWPAGRMDEAFMNAELMTSLGYAKLLWDATPKRRHPLIRGLLERSEASPEMHPVIRGIIDENRDNLGAGVIDELRRRLAGTRRGREELDGEFLDEDEGALWEQAWIDRNRRDMPTDLKRRIISIDPAISDRHGTDTTGIADLALGVDDQIYVIDDHSGTYVWERWGGLTIRLYMKHGCDCIVIERNRGGDACVANLRACAKEVGQRVEVLKTEARSRHQPGTIYVKEIFASKAKGIRAEPVATLYEQGRVSHVSGHDLQELEDLLTTWDPAETAASPDALDAMVHGCWELADLQHSGQDFSAGFKGLDKVADALKASSKVRGIAELLSTGRGDRWGRGI